MIANPELQEATPAQIKTPEYMRAALLAALLTQAECEQIIGAARSALQQAKANAKAITKRIEATAAAAAATAARPREPAESEALSPPPQIADDALIPDPVVAQIFHVHLRTLSRWDQNPDVGFPPAIKIRGRKYRRGAELNEFRRRKSKTS